MKNDWKNALHCEGYVFDHTLQNRVATKTGTPFIMGDLQVATDDEALNVVTVHFTYVTETFKSGKPNDTYTLLQSIIDNPNTFKDNGTDALKVRVDGRFEVNDFYTRDGQLASPKRFGGSFVHAMSSNTPLAAHPATFELEMVIAGYADKEVEDGDNYAEIRGYAFNFRNDVLPVTLNVRDAGGISYFAGQDISNSNPMVTKVWGDITSAIIKRETVVESAFGAAQTNVTTRTVHSWDVTGASVEPMEWDDESTITRDELKQALDHREEYLAGEKKRREEWEASQNGKKGFPKTSPAKAASDAVVASESIDDFEF